MLKPRPPTILSCLFGLSVGGFITFVLVRSAFKGVIPVTDLGRLMDGRDVFAAEDPLMFWALLCVLMLLSLLLTWFSLARLADLLTRPARSTFPE